MPCEPAKLSVQQVNLTRGLLAHLHTRCLSCPPTHSLTSSLVENLINVSIDLRVWAIPSIDLGVLAIPTSFSITSASTCTSTTAITISTSHKHPILPFPRPPPKMLYRLMRR
ncbi:hypothetical protein PoB_006903600 [Plakobranchus ocellatus]|uniref:Uncharacterized protein n=1 Tax=Plakobranchus ocellatus TaxID=259542 RepID=A0AAV4DEH9_9GAST|nr:hypothetical protein PoB_006903600 [Plakobranchus ocellatus]